MPGIPHAYTGTADCFRRTLKHEVRYGGMVYGIYGITTYSRDGIPCLIPGTVYVIPGTIQYTVAGTVVCSIRYDQVQYAAYHIPGTVCGMPCTRYGIRYTMYGTVCGIRHTMYQVRCTVCQVRYKTTVHSNFYSMLYAVHKYMSMVYRGQAVNGIPGTCMLCSYIRCQVDDPAVLPGTHGRA